MEVREGIISVLFVLAKVLSCPFNAYSNVIVALLNVIQRFGYMGREGTSHYKNEDGSYCAGT